MMLPAISFKGAATFNGANSIGRLPARPFDTPKAAVKKKAGNSPEIVGFLRGATQSRSSGMRTARRQDITISCRRDQAYGTAARIFPWRQKGRKRKCYQSSKCHSVLRTITSVVLNVNIKSTGIHVFKLHEMISDSKPG